MPEAKVIISAKDKTAKGFASVQKRLGGLTKMLGSTQAKIAGLVGVAGFGALIKTNADTQDALAKTSDRLGVQQERLGGLHYAVGQIAGDYRGFDEALTKATKRLGEFNATGGGAGAIWLKELNLDTQHLATLAPDELFNEYAKSIGGLNDRGQQLAAISALMGDESRKFINVIDAGPEAVNALAQEAQVLGIAITRLDAAKIEAANDALDRSQQVFSGVATTIAVELAPYVESVANSFGDAAVEHNGFKDVVLDGTEKVINAVAFMGDVWRGLEVVWVGLEIVLTAFVAATITSLSGVHKVVSNLINLIPGVDITPGAMLADWADTSQRKVIDLQAKLFVLMNEEMPSAGIEKAIAKIRELGEANALQVVEGTESKKVEQKLLEIEQLTAIEQTKYATELIAVNEHYAGMQIAEQQHQASLGNLEAQGIIQRRKFEEMNTRGKSKFVLGEMVSLTAGVAQHNKTAFRANQLAGAATATINTYEGVSKAWSLGPILGPIMAGLVALNGFATVKAIKSATFNGGGGGTTPSSAGSAPTVNSIPVAGASAPAEQAPRGTTNVTLVGSSADKMTVGQVDELFDQLGDAIERGDRILFSSGSRQALELGS